ncbi:MAG: hypothetical protein JRI23_12405 [Deltaproteobacteria bacterium]|jgi:hypothetical protein|nr:hypothetical protein [Deltaproteobacteria bacterium]MBW2532514.1 hypothetical protein [Deltaproteobacteria bacterium]
MKKRATWVGLFFALALAPGCSKQEGGACFNRSECAEGLACVGEGMRRCEKCADLELCTGFGKCTARDGACVAASDSECKQSYDCKQRGPCSAKDGVCVVGGDADCQQSAACAKEKQCVARGNNCVMSAEDKAAAAKAAADKVAAAKVAQEKLEKGEPSQP